MQLRKVWLNINGVNRMVVCNPETDSLADVLRRMGLTGTKIGCNYGQCGACTVLLEGAPIRSCVKKMRNLPEYSKIVTIEGIGTPLNLHPLQQAWIAYGGVQCGFCSPGFIVSAKGLLDVNPSPSRQEVRAWFQKHHNLCRCTGYRPLVDAVMAAAEVLRGERSAQSLMAQPDERGSIYGSRFPKPTAIEKVTGLSEYGGDLALKMPPGTLHLAIVQPKTSHAEIIAIDTKAAEQMPGVVRVITAKDVKGTNLATNPQNHPRAGSDGVFKPILCDKKIFRYGDVVAVVAAYSREQARAAAQQVKVELKELPAAMSALDALRPDALQIHPETPNVFCTSRLTKGADARTVFPNAPHVVEGSFYTSREPHLTIESDIYEAYMDEEDRVTIQCKSQTLNANRSQISKGVGLPVEKIRIIDNSIGGSFGYSMTPTGPAIMAVCEMALGCPLVMELSYEEHMAFSGKRAPSYTNARLACDEQGKILGLEYHMVVENGAYPEISTKLVEKCSRFVGYPYNVPNVSAIIQSVLSNHSFGVQYRGFGSPQAYLASESLMDMMAEQLGMDRFEFRYQNIARPGDLTVNSHPYREYPMQDMMEMMRPYYQAAVARAQQLSTDRKKRGVGLVWGGYAVSNVKDNADVELELNADGTITNYNSWEQMGQGSDIGSLTHTVEALLPLGIKPEQIRLVQNDTAITPVTGPASGSRSHYMAGNAILDAAQKLMDAMRKPDGSYRTYAEMKAEGIPTRYLGNHNTGAITIASDPDTCQGNPSPTANYLLMLAEVEVDMDTFATEVLSIKAISNVGKIGNRLAVEGQAYSGLSHSIGFALSENYEDVKKHATMLGAGIPQIMDIPDDIEYIFYEEPRATGPHGSAGCSEGFQSVGHAAVVNAINDAINTRIYAIPATPDKVKAAYEARQRGEDGKPAPYDFHSDMYELFDYIANHPIKK